MINPVRPAFEPPGVRASFCPPDQAYCVFMSMTFRYFALCILALMFVAANSTHALAQQPDKPAEKKDAPKATRINYPPMMFFVAKGAADECGPGCDTWIAAYGEIDSGAATRFQRFLDKLGKHDLPIFIQSPGGLTLRATTMGELLRARKLTISVGRSIPVACGDKLYTAECNKIRQSGPRIASRLETNAICASACVYMLLGGAKREIAWDSALGVHSSKVVLSRNGRQVRNVPPSLIRDAYRREGAMIDRYVAKMGIASELLTVTRSVPFESIRRLTREEIARFGIDKRDFGDSGWSAQAIADGSMAASVVMFRKGWGGANNFALVRLSLVCLSNGAVAIDYQTHGSDSSDWPSGNMFVRFGTERAQLLRKGDKKTGPTDRAVGMLSSDAVQRLERTDKIALWHENKPSEIAMETQISRAGFEPAVRKMLQECKTPSGEKKDEIAL